MDPHLALRREHVVDGAQLPGQRDELEAHRVALHLRVTEAHAPERERERTQTTSSCEPNIRTHVLMTTERNTWSLHLLRWSMRALTCRSFTACTTSCSTCIPVEA